MRRLENDMPSFAVLILFMFASLLLSSMLANGQTEEPLLQQRPVRRNADRIRPWAKNPRYWQYKGQPVLLVGGSKEDNLFQIPDLYEHLQLLASVGGNVIRNTMSDRDEGNVYPYRRLENGLYDLEQWNEEYWQRFANMLRWTYEKDIIVQIEVWDRFDLSREHWQRHPYRPANNVNYTEEQTGLADAYPEHPSSDKQPFFHTIPGMPKYQPRYDLLRRYQERFVAKMLSYSLPYGHVLYCMNNETTTDPRWGQHWMRFIKQKAAQAGVDVFVTDMFDDGYMPERSPNIRLVLDRPDLYDFIDISQINSRNFGEDHWRRLMWLMEQREAHPRPVNHTKIYSAGQTSFGSGTPQDGIERFWRNLLAGSASARFHRPTSGIGLNELAQACIRTVRLVEQDVKFWDLKPHMELLSEREPNEAYLGAQPGKSYVLFFCKGGAVGLDLRTAPGAFVLKWLDISSGTYKGAMTLSGGTIQKIEAPSEAPWIALIIRP